MVRIVSKGAFGAPLILSADDLNNGLAAMLFSAQFAATETSSFARSDGKTVTKYQISGHSDFASAVSLSVASPAGVYITYVTYFDSSNSPLLTLRDVNLKTNNAGGANPLDPSALLAPFVSDPRLSLTGDDHVIGGSRDDYVEGREGSDYLSGRGGDDSLFGGDGNDKLRGGAGADWLDGGDGFDMAVYSREGSAVTANLSRSNQNAGAAAGDTFISIEGLSGTAFDDSLTGDYLNNKLFGGAGDDILVGLLGNDALRGGDGDDDLDGGSGKDNLTGGAGDDMLNGGSGNDVLMGEDGNDTLIGGTGKDDLQGGAGDDLFLDVSSKSTVDGGDGLDTIDFSAATSGAKTNDRKGLTLKNTETVIGSDFDDKLTVRDGDNTVYGGTGDDYISDSKGANSALYGGEGNDKIFSDADNAKLYGEGGDDNLYGDLYASGSIELYGGDGNDKLYGYLSWKNGTMTAKLYGEDGDDDLRAYSSSSKETRSIELYGGDGNDSLSGSGGANTTITMSGGAGNDFLETYGGQVTMRGGDGDDRFGLESIGKSEKVDAFGDAGNDAFVFRYFNSVGSVTVTGGADNDSFDFQRTSSNSEVIVTDWSDEELIFRKDILFNYKKYWNLDKDERKQHAIDNAATEADIIQRASVANGDLVIDMSDTNSTWTITLQGVTDANDLSGWISFV